MLYLEWDGFVGVLECWGNVLKSDPDLRSVLVWKCMYMCITRTCHVYAHATCTCTCMYVVYRDEVHFKMYVHVYDQYILRMCVFLCWVF